MAAFLRQIQGLERAAAFLMQDVQALDQTDEITHLRIGALAPPLVQIGDEGRAADGGKDRTIIAQPQIACRIARMQREGGGRKFQLFLHQAAIQPGHLPGVIHLGTGLFQIAPGFGFENLDTDLFQDFQRCLMNGLNLVFAQHIGGRRVIADLMPWLLCDLAAVPFRPCAAPGAPSGGKSGHDHLPVDRALLDICTIINHESHPGGKSY